jgi:DNA-binding NtrC family response regulator
MSIHILHIEDERDLRSVFAEVILIIDSEVRLKQFQNADESLSYIVEYGATVDVFVLDIRLPGELTGLQLAAKIRELGCEGRIIITSAYQMPPVDLLQNLRAEYVSKPWNVPDFFMHILDSAAK